MAQPTSTVSMEGTKTSLLFSGLPMDLSRCEALNVYEILILSPQQMSDRPI